MEATSLSVPEYLELDVVYVNNKWSKEDDDRLKNLVRKYHSDWDVIKLYFPNKTALQCHQRWKNVLNPGIVKGYWTKEEDDQLVSLVERYGTKKWTLIGSHLKGRIGKQCRERWHNHLDPKLKRTPWTKEEDETIIKAHQLYGNHWSKIAKLLKGRSDNSIKNHWNSVIKKQFERESICGKKIEEESDLASSIKVELHSCEEGDNELRTLSTSLSKPIQSKYLVTSKNHIFENFSDVNGWLAMTTEKDNEDIEKCSESPPLCRTPEGSPLKIKQEFGTPQTPTPFKKILKDIEKKMKIKSASRCSVLDEIQQTTSSYKEKENAKPIGSVSRALSFTKADPVLEKTRVDLYSRANGDSLFQNDITLCGDLLKTEPIETDFDCKGKKMEVDVEKWATIACGYTSDQLILTDLAYRYLRGEE